jgi:hypothetical protein
VVELEARAALPQAQLAWLAATPFAPRLEAEAEVESQPLPQPLPVALGAGLPAVRSHLRVAQPPPPLPPLASQPPLTSPITSAVVVVAVPPRLSLPSPLVLAAPGPMVVAAGAGVQPVPLVVLAPQLQLTALAAKVATALSPSLLGDRDAQTSPLRSAGAPSWGASLRPRPVDWPAELRGL